MGLKKPRLNVGKKSASGTFNVPYDNKSNPVETITLDFEPSEITLFKPSNGYDEQVAVWQLGNPINNGKIRHWNVAMNTFVSGSSVINVVGKTITFSYGNNVNSSGVKWTAIG